MTILVFPSAIEAAAKFAEEARQWGRRVIGASSVENDPNAARFDAWERLPFIGDPGFFPALADIVARWRIEALYTPHPATFRFLERELAQVLPDVRLMGSGPFKRQMDRVRDALSEAETGLATAAVFGERPSHLPLEFMAGLLVQVETIHGECAREKILAMCGVLPFAPKGDVVEIGSLYGKSGYVLNRLASYCGVGATLCVDPWDLAQSVQNDAPVNIQQTSHEWDWEIVHRGFLLAMLSCAAPPLNYLRTTSAQAARLYAESDRVTTREFGTTLLAGSISVLHLDGNHDEAAVAEDFNLWSPRMLAGGWIIFDDYNWPHGDGPRNVADRALRQFGSRIHRRFVAGGAMFMNLASDVS